MVLNQRFIRVFLHEGESMVKFLKTLGKIGSQKMGPVFDTSKRK
jgi:hypothetical protein